MTSKERIVNQLRGREVDRIPMLSGWNEGVRNLAELAGITVEEYLVNPEAGVLRANRSLGVDGMIGMMVPTSAEEIRTGHCLESSFNYEPEDLKKRAEQIPDTEKEVLSGFDAAVVESQYRHFLESEIEKLDGMVYIPTIFDVPVNWSYYFQYGYVAYLQAIALYPDEVAKIYWADSVSGRRRNEIIARLIKEYDLPPVIFCGNDICNNDGPMCSPKFLNENYWPRNRYALEPIVDAGIRLVHHCDGNVMPLIDGMIESGFSGFQGFQYECGVDPYLLAERRSLLGESPIFFAGLSCSRTLPFGTPEQVIEEVEYCLDYTDGGRGLFLFTSSSTGMEVPPQNLLAAYHHLAAYDPRVGRGNAPKRPEWPWSKIS